MRRAPLALCLAALVAGCGLGAGDEPSGTRLLVTRDFGSRVVIDEPRPEVGGSDTVMRLLQRNARVQTRFGGAFVHGIDGITGGERSGREFDWFFFVNGSQGEKGAAAIRVHEGDSVWWDNHDWGEAIGVPAVVGQFPEPFRNGLDGERLPTRMECADSEAPACDAVARALTKAGVVVGRSQLSPVPVKETLRVLVGPWKALRGDAAAKLLEEGPQDSGVYARPARDGRSIALLTEVGEVARTLRAGAGLVAATKRDDDRPVWLVTGTDAAGVEAAARALDEGVLARRFALAIADGRGVPLPERGA